VASVSVCVILINRRGVMRRKLSHTFALSIDPSLSGGEKVIVLFNIGPGSLALCIRKHTMSKADPVIGLFWLSTGWQRHTHLWVAVQETKKDAKQTTTTTLSFQNKTKSKTNWKEDQRFFSPRKSKPRQAKGADDAQRFVQAARRKFAAAGWYYVLSLDCRKLRHIGNHDARWMGKENGTCVCDQTTQRTYTTFSFLIL
jgi:hypothetical protein